MATNLRTGKKGKTGKIKRFMNKGIRSSRKRRWRSTKEGLKGYYKGVGVPSLGKSTSKGAFVMDLKKVPVFDVPSLEGFQYSPYVSKSIKKPVGAAAPPPPPRLFRGWVTQLDKKEIGRGKWLPVDLPPMLPRKVLDAREASRLKKQRKKAGVRRRARRELKRQQLRQHNILVTDIMERERERARAKARHKANWKRKQAP